MSFKPINDDHAVQSVALSVHFDRHLDQSVMQYVQSQHQRWQADLPAVQMPQMFGFEIGPAGAAPKQTVGHGVEFSYLRPDGTPAWQLRFEGSAVIVECTRYTRWERVWQSAKKYLLNAIDVIIESQDQSDVKVSAASLQYTDRFSGSSFGNDFKSIFCENRYLSTSVFEFGDVWHTHLGWFDRTNQLGPILNNLNIDAKNDVALEGSPIIVDILHLQQLRYDQKATLPEFRASTDLIFDRLMQELHLQNKVIICELLDPQMKQKIGIAPEMASEATKAP